MIWFILKAALSALIGWIPAAVMLLVIAGCARWEDDPLAVYRADPKAFQLWIVSF